MSGVKYEQLYAAGKYEDCKKELKDILYEIYEGRDVSTLVLSSRLDTWAAHVHPHTLTLILKGNIIHMSTLIVLQSNTKKEWKLHSSQLDFYKKIRLLSKSGGVVPFPLYLNSLYNALWLTWMTGIYNDMERNEVYEMLEDCFKKVLALCKTRTVYSSNEPTSESIVGLLHQVVKCLIHLENNECLQVVEISVLCLLLLLDFKIVSGYNKSLIYELQSTMLQVEQKYAIYSEKNRDASKSLSFFKYGFFQENDRTNYDVKKLSECVCISSCLWLFALGHMKECAEILENSNVSGTCSKFMCTYLQALISHELKEHHLSELYINKLSRLQMNEITEVHFHFLKGQHKFFIGHVIETHSEFTTLLHKSHSICRGLFHIINNLSKTVHTIFNKYGQSAIIGKFAEALTCFYKYTISTCFTTEEIEYNLQGKFFSILHEAEKRKMEDIMYILGKEMLWVEVLHMSSENSYNLSSIAAECYLDILCKYYESSSYSQYFDQCVWITLHEAVIVFILCDKTDAADTICKILNEKCIPVETVIADKQITKEEVLLIEKGVVTLMLIAYVKVYKKEWERAQDILSRIKKISIQLHFSTKNSHSNQVPSLLDAVTARTYVLKSALHVKAGYNDDALQGCHRALVHNPADDVVQNCIKIAKKIGAEIRIPEKRNQFPISQCRSLLLLYLLTAELPL